MLLYWSGFLPEPMAKVRKNPVTPKGITGNISSVTAMYGKCTAVQLFPQVHSELRSPESLSYGTVRGYGPQDGR